MSNSSLPGGVPRSALNCVSRKTIQNMEEAGAPAGDIAFARATRESTEANHVAFHRAYISQYNPRDPWREPNNWIMHPTNYAYGGGHRSPEYMAHMFSQLNHPVILYGPQFYVQPPMQPYVVFQTPY